MFSARITGYGKYLPERIMTNFDLEKIVDTSDEWITTRTGIKERRIAAENETSTELGTYAAQKALDNANLKPDDIDLVICATNSPAQLFPATAGLIHKGLKLPVSAGGFDLQSGCTGFVYGLEIASDMIKFGRMKNIIVVGVDTCSKITNWEDRDSCVLFGDGAGAIVLSKSNEENCGVLSSCLGLDSNYSDDITLAGGIASKSNVIKQTIKDSAIEGWHFIKLNGQRVFKFAVRYFQETVNRVLNESKISIKDIDFIIPHQANIRIIEAAAKVLKYPIEKFFINIQKYGNTSAATIPISLEECYTQGLIKKGDLILTVAFGAGASYGANLIKV